MMLFFRRIWIAIIVERRGGTKHSGGAWVKTPFAAKLFDK
ncbi:hypothetical protein NEISUBOT_03204 [Neisseria subflava NJ9703]|uniref:Uncharacterized protein n=1 Tax=Neisseria subflava NJ9703 TaxID=546268 RepID=A0A9W5ISZ3_NEISU|nr:hypothetical protein NEISUBOT_03204 [Neisseria subflava NJ9703]